MVSSFILLSFSIVCVYRGVLNDLSVIIKVVTLFLYHHGPGTGRHHRRNREQHVSELAFQDDSNLTPELSFCDRVLPLTSEDFGQSGPYDPGLNFSTLYHNLVQFPFLMF